MPIHEIKDPSPAPQISSPKQKIPEEVLAVAPMVRIKQYADRKILRKQRSAAEQAPAPAPNEEKFLRLLIEEANDSLDRLEIALHLVLIIEEGDYLLEIYDCTQQQVCRVVKELEITPAELPELLRKLQLAAGLMVDTVS
jgi:hypothetical protein